MASLLLYARDMRTAFTLILLATTSSLAVADDLAIAEPREPRLAVATDPIGLFAARYALSATFVRSRWVALRADVEVIDDTSGFGAGGWRAALSFPLYLQRPLHGPYVEPGLALVDRVVGYAVTGGGIGGLGGMGSGAIPAVVAMRERRAEPQIFVGWQWSFPSGLHLAAAVGVSRRFAPDGSGSSVAIPESYLRVGYAL